MTFGLLQGRNCQVSPCKKRQVAAMGPLCISHFEALSSSEPIVVLLEPSHAEQTTTPIEAALQPHSQLLPLKISGGETASGSLGNLLSLSPKSSSGGCLFPSDVVHLMSGGGLPWSSYFRSGTGFLLWEQEDFTLGNIVFWWGGGCDWVFGTSCCGILSPSCHHFWVC